MSLVRRLILKMSLKLNLNHSLLLPLLFFFQITMGIAQNNCGFFLESNQNKVDGLIKIAQKSDSFWRYHYKLLGVVLPEFLAESETEIESEIQIFKTLNLFDNKTVNTISLGPFQMQPQFIYNVIRNSKVLNRNFNFKLESKESDLIRIRNNIDTFVSIDFQLNILKSFVLMESKRLKQKPSQCINQLSAIYNGLYGKRMKYKEKYFSKLTCTNLTYSQWSDFLGRYYFNGKGSRKLEN